MMKSTLTKKLPLAGALIGVCVFGYFAVTLDRLVRIGAGYKAKMACSEIFLAGRDAESVLNNEFAGMDPVLEQIPVRVDEKSKQTRASGSLGLGQARAIYREGYGCTLTNGGRVSEAPPLAPIRSGAPLPEFSSSSGNALAHVDYAAMDKALNDAFENNTLAHRSFLVIVDGGVVAERYADRFSEETLFLSWSMAKSVTATLIGAAVFRDHLSISGAAAVAAWQDDPVRSAISWNDLMQMQSGLDFEENYDKARSDVNRMLFEAPDTAKVALRSPGASTPGSAWYYSSGTSNILSWLLRDQLSAQNMDDQAFARDALFSPIGATSFTLEPDASGTFIGSSFAYATARDWGRLGQLYLQDGIWGGERLLPEGWIDFVTTPASQSDNQYGAQFWLNRDGLGDRPRSFPGIPEEAYMMAGHEGQYVLIIPSKSIVIVRTGLTRGQEAMPAVAPLMEAVYKAVGEKS